MPISPLQPAISPEQVMKKINEVEGKFASLIAGSAGNMWFIYFHVFWFSFWFFANHGSIPFIEPFDPFPYGLLTMIVSLEAIFLATFILINQNRQALVDTYRELEFERGQMEDVEQQEDIGEDVEDIQKDINDIKGALSFIQGKLTNVEKAQGSNGNGH